MSKEEKNKGGRPSKKKAWTDHAEEVINKDPFMAIVLTDEELVEHVNDSIEEEKEKIGISIFKAWKSAAKEGKLKDEDGKRFLALIKKLLAQEKRNLTNRMLSKDEKNSWTRFAWIIERKFDEWNIRHKQDIATKGSMKIIVETNIPALEPEVPST